MVTTAVPGAEQRNLEVRVKVRDVVLFVHMQELAREVWFHSRSQDQGGKPLQKLGPHIRTLYICASFGHVK